MATRKYTEARAAANRRYDDKTYRKFTFYLRVDDDADVIHSIDEAKQSGTPLREWLANLFRR